MYMYMSDTRFLDETYSTLQFAARASKIKAKITSYHEGMTNTTGNMTMVDARKQIEALQMRILQYELTEQKRKQDEEERAAHPPLAPAGHEHTGRSNSDPDGECYLCDELRICLQELQDRYDRMEVDAEMLGQKYDDLVDQNRLLARKLQSWEQFQRPLSPHQLVEDKDGGEYDDDVFSVASSVAADEVLRKGSEVLERLSHSTLDLSTLRPPHTAATAALNDDNHQAEKPSSAPPTSILKNKIEVIRSSRTDIGNDELYTEYQDLLNHAHNNNQRSSPPHTEIETYTQYKRRISNQSQSSTIIASTLPLPDYHTPATPVEVTPSHTVSDSNANGVSTGPSEHHSKEVSVHEAAATATPQATDVNNHTHAVDPSRHSVGSEGTAQSQYTPYSQLNSYALSDRGAEDMGSQVGLEHVNDRYISEVAGVVERIGHVPVGVMPNSTISVKAVSESMNPSVSHPSVAAHTDAVAHNNNPQTEKYHRTSIKYDHAVAMPSGPAPGLYHTSNPDTYVEAQSEDPLDTQSFIPLESTQQQQHTSPAPASPQKVDMTQQDTHPPYGLIHSKGNPMAASAASFLSDISSPSAVQSQLNTIISVAAPAPEYAQYTTQKDRSNCYSDASADSDHDEPDYVDDFNSPEHSQYQHNAIGTDDDDDDDDQGVNSSYTTAVAPPDLTRVDSLLESTSTFLTIAKPAPIVLSRDGSPPRSTHSVINSPTMATSLADLNPKSSPGQPVATVPSESSSVSSTPIPTTPILANSSPTQHGSFLPPPRTANRTTYPDDMIDKSMRTLNLVLDNKSTSASHSLTTSSLQQPLSTTSVINSKPPNAYSESMTAALTPSPTVVNIKYQDTTAPFMAAYAPYMNKLPKIFYEEDFAPTQITGSGSGSTGTGTVPTGYGGKTAYQSIYTDKNNNSSGSGSASTVVGMAQMPRSGQNSSSNGKKGGGRKKKR